MRNDEDGFEDRAPFWQCQECGFENHTKPMPKSKALWNARKEFPLCPKCRSEAFVPVGW